MSKANPDRARKRFEQAKEDIFWAIAVLNDPATHLQQYHLSQDEIQALLQVFHQDLEEIQIALAQSLPRRSIFESTDTTIEVVEEKVAVVDTYAEAELPHHYDAYAPSIEEDHYSIRKGQQAEGRAVEIPPEEDVPGQ